MALPSSPPSLSEDPPSSPPLLPTLSSVSLTAPPTRKRQLSDHGSLSSDPLFSEDASDVEFREDDAQPRRKRLVRGPWWSLGKRAGRNLRRDMAKKDSFRNVDSGVWMGSDDSTDSSASEQSRMGRLPVHGAEASATDEEPAVDPESFATRIIHGCLENGKEMVDLSGLNLSSISNATLRPLHQMIRQTHSDLTRPPSEDEFTPLTPSIQLFLYGNRLTSLPSELFRLTNITVLSLRNNELEEVPPQLARLDRLKELNIAGNGLRFLPWELLQMLRMQPDSCKISLRPNPFLTVQLDERTISALLADFERGRQTCTSIYGTDSSREQLIFVAASRIKFLDVDGVPVRAEPSLTPKSKQHWHEVSLDPQPPPPSGASLSPPSLFELALRSAQVECNMNDMLAWCTTGAPPTIRHGLQEAARGVELGNRQCSACGKQFVMARAEWLEYWFYGLPKDALAEDKVLPFKRLACSWRCALVTPVGTGFV